MDSKILDTPVRVKYTSESYQLRQELKTWEASFAQANDGTKPGREDIKVNAEIAAKYKSYNTIRDLLDGKAPIPKPARRKVEAPTPSKKRTSLDAALPTSYRTPKRQHSTLEMTGSRSAQSHPAQIDPYDTPSKLQLMLTPSERLVIGPTPQRDGQALGLFDLMSDDEPTPIRPPRSTGNGRTAFTELLNGSTIHPATPAGARTGLSIATTPLSGRKLLQTWPDGLPGSIIKITATPSTNRQLHFDTPAFLRRDSQLESRDPGRQQFSSPAPKKPPNLADIRTSKYGLSSMLANLRKMESDALDEDLELLREMEDPDSYQQPPPKPRPRSQKLQRQEPDVQDAKPASVDEPPVPDELDDDPQFSTDLPPAESQPKSTAPADPKKTYKKRGQKRTTRHTIMRPVKAKIPVAEPTEDELQATDDAVEEGDGKTKPVKVKMKKTKATAHANYKRLKIRGQGVKRPGFGGRRR